MAEISGEGLLTLESKLHVYWKTMGNISPSHASNIWRDVSPGTGNLCDAELMKGNELINNEHQDSHRHSLAFRI